MNTSENGVADSPPGDGTAAIGTAGDAVLRSPRLLLRPITAADIDAVVAYRSLPEVCRYVPFEPMDRTAVAERVAGLWQRRTLQAEGDALFFGVELVATGEFMGDLMMHWSSATHRTAEIGYVFHPAFGGRGYATEATHRLLHLVFDELRLRRVVARVDADNLASVRLLERLGMRREAHLVENEWFKGRWGDEYDYAMLDREWAALPHEDCRREGDGAASV